MRKYDLSSIDWDSGTSTGSPYDLTSMDWDSGTPEESSFFGDLGRAYMAGSASLAEAAGYGLETLGADTFGGWLRERARDSRDSWESGYSDEFKAARQKEFVTQDAAGDYSFGDAWADPRAIGGALVQSVPGTMLGMGLGGALAKGFSIVPQIGPKVAGVLGYGTGEAAVASLSAGSNTYEEVLRMPQEVLEQSPEYQAALAGTGDVSSARELVARAAGEDATALTALTTFVLSAPAGAVLGKFTAGLPLATTRARSVAVGFGAEGAQEFLQSGAEQLSQNIAIRDNADPTRDAEQGVLNQAVGGMFAGGLMGAAVGAASPLDRAPGAPADEPGAKALTTIDDIANDLRRPYAEAAEEGANQARDIVAQSGGDALSQELAASDVVWSAISQSPTRDDVERTYGRQLQMMQVDEQQAQEAEALRQERLKALDQDGEASVAWMSPGPDGQWRPKAEILPAGKSAARREASNTWGASLENPTGAVRAPKLRSPKRRNGRMDLLWQGQPNEMLGGPAEAEAAEATAAPAPRWQPTGNTVERVMADLSQDADIGSALGTLTSSRALNIVQSPDQLPPEVQAALSQSAETGAPQGLVWKGRMWLVADSIEAGRARGVLLHEGQHYAMERRENSQTYKALQSNFDRLLDSRDVNAVRAMRRVQSANTADVEQERLAYFLEEVVNNPDQASGRERVLAARIMQDVRLWFRETKVGKWLEAHGAGFNLTPQEIVQIVKRGMIRQAQTEARTAAPGGLQASRRGARTDLGLYSALSRNVVSLATNAAPSAGWKSAITGMVNKGQVKQEEVEWSGVMDWLDTQDGKVTKEQVADYLDSGGVQVEETVLGMSEASRTKYDGYRAPGGENYREVLLRLPTGGPSKLEAMSASKLRAVIARIDRNADTDEMSRDELLEMINYMVEDSELTDRDFAEYVGKNAATYKSSHWDQPNVLAHMRVDDRVDTEGKRVLFVNEIQSDWGQEGKKKGFEGDPVFAEGMRGREEGFLGLNASGVPSAPFVTNTSGWVNLALKRVITMASEGGYDRVAVAKGNQNAKLYDQLQDVERVEFLRASGGAYAAPTDLGPGVLRVWGRQGRGGRPRLILDKYLQNPAEAETIIGKDATRKLLEQPGEPSNRGGSPTHIRSLSGLDMQIGGEGMRAFYDEIVPAALKKLLPKVGGAGLRTVTINIDGKPTEQVGFDVTPAMREKSADGVPQFSRRQTETPEFKRWFGDSKVVDADGKPLVVYHGTDAPNFTSFKRGAWFTANPSEASAYSFVANLMRREKALGKYTVQSGSQFDGQAFDYFGALSDIESPKKGQIYATDGGVFEYLGNGKWTVFHDLAVDYEASDETVATVRRSDNRFAAESLRDEADNFVRQRSPGGEGGRVYPVYLSIKNPARLSPLEANRIANRLGMGDKEIDATISKYEAQGYDGIETVSDEASTSVDAQAGLGGVPRQYIAFRPEQIKSAIGNSGQFDPENPSIQFSRAGQVDTPEFKRWFGDSKVVDADGKPLVVYHGTDAKFTVFDMMKSPDGAHFFTPDESHAGSFGDPGAFFVRIVNPLEISQDDLDAAWDAEHPDGDQDERNLLPRDFVKDFVRQARDQGYDGLVIRNMGDRDIQADMYLPLSPEQIKSAIGNSGQFDPENPDIRFSRRERDFENPEDRVEVSTARVTPAPKKGRLSNSYDEKWVIDGSDVRASTTHMNKVYRALQTYNTLSGKGDAPALMKELHDVIVDNLLWLHDLVPEPIRNRARLWYDGANRIANDWSTRYDITVRQASGVLAVLSPQMDWFKNVSLAERVITILKSRQNEAWSPEMTAWLESWVNASRKVDEKAKRQAILDEARAIEGRTLAELNDREASIYVRVFDETYFERRYRLVTPEGGFGDYVTKNDEGESSVTWGGFETIEKAVSIMRDGSFRNVEARLGDEHKVRNFFNNIIAPGSRDGHVTIDTHAVAAALVKAVSGSSREVLDNFSAAGSNPDAGASGTYGLFADAYRDAALQRGILPREMQSITWEAIRALFPASMKSQLAPQIDAIWDAARQDGTPRDQAREKIRQLAGGIRSMAWEGSTSGTYASEGGASFNTEIAESPADRTARTLEPQAAKDSISVNLSANTGSIPGIDRLQAAAARGDMLAHRLLQDIALDNLRHLLAGTSARIVADGVTGLYGGYVESGLSLTITFADYDRAAVLAGLAKFAENYNQEQVHVRRGLKNVKAGTTYADGSYATPVYRWELKEPLSRQRVQQIITRSGLAGLTFGDDFIETYYIGDFNEQDFARFEQNIQTAARLVGGSAESFGRQIEQVWPYGRGAGGIGYGDIQGDVPAGTGLSNETAKRVAGYLNRVTGPDGKAKLGPVKTFDAAEITDSQRDLQAAIADIYNRLPENDLKNVHVRRAYEQLAKEVLRQFDAMPVKVEVYAGAGEPYANSDAMRRDLLDNNHLYIFGTTPETFGPPGSDFSGHPLLKPADRVDQNDRPLLLNDLLRAVHDYYAHSMSPTQFGPKGEEAAWKNHMAMTPDPWARWALTSETRGQNSWVNFRDGLDPATPLSQRSFAPQKAALMPVEYMLTGDRKVDAPVKAFIEKLGDRVRQGSKLGAQGVQFSRAEVASPSAVDAEQGNQYNPEPGADSAPDSAPAKPLADIQITDDYVIAETGETVSVTERADIRLRQLDKRLAVARRLVLCLGG